MLRATLNPSKGLRGPAPRGYNGDGENVEGTARASGTAHGPDPPPAENLSSPISNRVYVTYRQLSRLEGPRDGQTEGRTRPGRKGAAKGRSQPGHEPQQRKPPPLARLHARPPGRSPEKPRPVPGRPVKLGEAGEARRTPQRGGKEDGFRSPQERACESPGPTARLLQPPPVSPRRPLRATRDVEERPPCGAHRTGSEPRAANDLPTTRSCRRHRHRSISIVRHRLRAPDAASCSKSTKSTPRPVRP